MFQGFLSYPTTPPAILCRRVAATMKKIFSYSSDRGFAPTALINRRAAACIAVDGIFNLYKKTTDVVFEFRRGCEPTAYSIQNTAHRIQHTEHGERLQNKFHTNNHRAMYYNK